MKLITRDIDYAVRAICYIARKNGSVVAVNELVRCLKVPRPYIRKILQKLNKSGILSSIKGKGGGFRLGMKTGRIEMAGLIEVFGGPIRLSEHKFKKKACKEIKRCPLKKKLDYLERYIVAQLKQMDMETLLSEGERVGWQGFG